MSTPVPTETEQEIIVLRAVWDMIRGMVNYEIFGKNHDLVDAELRFDTRTHQRLFNILLTDFLSSPSKGTFGLPAANGPGPTDRTYLFYLRRICDNPKLNSEDSDIRRPVDSFIAWLDGYSLVPEVWLPAIGVETDICVKRIIFLKICGDIAKHNFARLSVNVQRICKLLAENGVIIDEAQGFLALPDFYEWFHNNIFAYHASTIAEHLNNLRWGIFEYLRPEFIRSFQKIDSIQYRFNYPEDCDIPLARAMYWDLMNEVRFEPWFPRFAVTKYLKLRY